MRICEKRPLKINIIHSILYTRIFVLIIIMYKGWCGFTWKRKNINILQNMSVYRLKHYEEQVEL